jgi:hypothetical protein
MKLGTVDSVPKSVTACMSAVIAIRITSMVGECGITRQKGERKAIPAKLLRKNTLSQSALFVMNSFLYQTLSSTMPQNMGSVFSALRIALM